MSVIESGLLNSDMTRPEFEIHHRRDDLTGYQPQKEAPIRLHHHDFYEVYYFISGNVTYYVENKSYQLSKGDILFISPLELHQPVFSPETGIYERIVLWMDPKKLMELSTPEVPFLDCFKKARHGTDAHLYYIPNDRQWKLTEYLDDLILRSRESDSYTPLVCDAFLTLVFCSFHSLTSEPPISREMLRMSPQVAHCVDYINLHLGEDLSLDRLSQECFISKQHLLRMFKEAMGFSVHQYIQKKRLLTARSIIQEGSSPKEAALQCGFSDYSVFYRAYRKEYGKSPTQ